ncbi:MAG: DUF364 domain-containing protein [Pseudomonadota bacterium]|nr:DUF364 domain-containing protein [Pseudomonadota bacterium]
MPVKPEDYNRIYDLIAARAVSDASVEQVLLGLNWSLVSVRSAAGRTTEQGLCYSPVNPPRNLSWPGTLTGRRVNDLLPWLHSWENSETVVALAAANAVLASDNALLLGAQRIGAHRQQNIPANLAVFAHFAEQIRGKRVAVIGRYPQLQRFEEICDLVCIERNPGPQDLPDTAANYILPQADWVFITASSLANKSLPHLLWLARRARVVLMGPSMPWLAEWAEFGVDYLAGVRVEDEALLQRIIAEGGGTRIFDQAAPYRVAALG